MTYLKACPRCHGDLIPDEDGNERYFSCLQCGHILSTVEESALQIALARHANQTFAKTDLRTTPAEKLQPVGRGDESMALAS